VATSGLCQFWWWPVQDSVIFAGFWHIGKLGGGKKDETPCISLITVWCNIWFGINWCGALSVEWLFLHIRRVNIDREAFNL
jgi:hypothetical protein